MTLTPERLSELKELAGKATCQSYRWGQLTCADGFVQKAICGGHSGCVSCGHHSDDATPWCEREDIPSRFLREDGSPLFYRASKKGATP